VSLKRKGKLIMRFLAKTLGRKLLIILLNCIICCALLLYANGIAMADAIANNNPIYQQRVNHSGDGIGKFYMGREIAQYMNHQAAGWLERPTRGFEEKPRLVVEALNLQPTDIVADIGAGTGYFSFRIASLVPDGKVLAVDIQPEMLEIIELFKQEKNIDNVEPILGSETSPNLPKESIDLAFMVDAYHEFSYPFEMMSEVVKALKPGGRVVLVEYRGENPFIPIKGLHKMRQNQVKKEMSVVGLTWIDTQEFLPQQHFMVFEKPTAFSSRL
jgi:ubiquinone/menaquinone biosynthesis C-methylase UbiE